MTAHPCPICGLRYQHRAEVTDHVRAEHTESHVAEDEQQETIQARKREEGSGGGEVMHLPW